jgi:predicted alpha/beta-hydrolase family hydrolase
MSRPFFLFAHGAGAPSKSAWVQAWTRRLESLGDVLAFDYPYMRAGRTTPDRQPALIAAHREALLHARQRAAEPSAENRPMVLIGKSMGGRIGCHVALEEPVDRVVCLGYPLQSGSTGALRDEVLVALRTPVLFVQGTRDPLCSLDRLAEVRTRMTAPNLLHVVPGGNHSLEVSAAQRRAAGQSQDDVDAAVLDVIRRFVEEPPAGRK